MNPVIEIIIPSYKRYNNLHIIINSFIVQTNKNWRIHVISDGEDLKTSLILAKYILEHDNIKYSYINGPNDDWGHACREYGLLHSDSEWILMTSDDNYYVPTFIEEFTNIIKSNQQIGLVYCNMIHNNRNYHMIDSMFKSSYIDIGSFISKVDLAKKIGFTSRTYDADWKFIDKYISTYSEYLFKKTNNILFVHN